MNKATQISISTSAGFLVAVIALAASCSAAEVAIDQDDRGNFVLTRDGKPYVIRGAGGSTHLADIVKNGGNSIRTWGIDTLYETVDGKPLLDRCEELGISVAVGIWIEHERHGFDYSDETQVRDQRNLVRAAVRKYKDHPALLVWGLGNEMEGPTTDGNTPHIWKEMNVLASIVKEEDPHHPVMTVIAGSSANKVKEIIEFYPNIDILGVNAYAAASSAAGDVKAAGWKRPFVLAEFGPSGHWEVDKTPWGAPIEPSCREKAASYFVTHQILMEEASDICIGSYCFLWGQKQETTSTWYGMFLPTAEKLPQVDAMCKVWTGKWPKNRCPRVSSIESDLRESVVAPKQTFTARMIVTDPEDDPLRWTWTVVQESTDIKSGGDKESVPPSFPDCIVSAKNGEAVIRVPEKPGNYRLFAIVKVDQGGASAENICFQVKSK
jgi:hypothetical protein